MESLSRVLHDLAEAENVKPKVVMMIARRQLTGMKVNCSLTLAGSYC